MILYTRHVGEFQSFQKEPLISVLLLRQRHQHRRDVHLPRPRARLPFKSFRRSESSGSIPSRPLILNHFHFFRFRNSCANASTKRPATTVSSVSRCTINIAGDRETPGLSVKVSCCCCCCGGDRRAALYWSLACPRMQLSRTRLVLLL